jgi:hypothetical protein
MSTNHSSYVFFRRMRRLWHMTHLFSGRKTDKKDELLELDRADNRLLMTCCTWNLKSGNRVYQILETLIFVLGSCERSRPHHHLWSKCWWNNFLRGPAAEP